MIRKHANLDIDREIVPLFMEMLTYDIIFIDEGFNEKVFRYACSKYQLMDDPDVKEHLDSYYKSIIDDS